MNHCPKCGWSKSRFTAKITNKLSEDGKALEVKYVIPVEEAVDLINKIKSIEKITFHGETDVVIEQLD